MKLLKLFKREKKLKEEMSDMYQLSLNRIGREQFRKMIEKGLQIPVMVL